MPSILSAQHMEMEKNQSFRFRGAFVLLLTLGISIAFFAMVRPFLLALLVAAISAGMLHPVYRGLRRFFRGRRVPAALLTVILLFLFILGPLTAFFGIVVKQAVDVSQSAIPWVKESIGTESQLAAFEDWFKTQFPAFQEYAPTREQVFEVIAKLTQNAGNYIVSSVSKMTAGTASFFLMLFVMLYSLFFFLIDGHKLLEKIFYYSPLTEEEDRRLSDRFLSVTRATIKGSLVIGLIQGGLCGIAFAIADIPGSAFWGTVMAILSVIPGLGTSIVWIPACLILGLSGDWLVAVILAGWCGGIVGNVDNLLRPRLIGEDAKLPDLLILLGTLGGLFLFGAIGFLIGPIICSLFVAIWEIYGETFKRYLPSANSGSESEKDQDDSSDDGSEPGEESPEPEGV